MSPGHEKVRVSILLAHINQLSLTQLVIIIVTCSFITFCVSRRQREMYCGHARLSLCVCLSVCGHMPTLLHGPECNLG